MSEVVLELSHVSVAFRQRPRLSLLRTLAGRNAPVVRPALVDVSLALARGESLGVVGSNGAGKTTLLSVAGGGVLPDSGDCRATPDVARIIDLGSDLHPALSARENALHVLRMQGSTLVEARAAMEEVFDFADLDPTALDLPVGGYSSGMLLRLAFALVVVREPRLLLIDEVLAVGDAAFQVRCAERINQLRRAGCALLVASHSPDQLRATCDQVLWLSRGEVVDHGSTEDVLRRYELSHTRDGAEESVTTALALVVDGATQRERRAGGWDQVTVLVPEEARGPGCVTVTLRRAGLGVLARCTLPRAALTASFTVGLNLWLGSGDHYLDVEVRHGDRVVAALMGAVHYTVPGRLGAEGIVEIEAVLV